MKKENSPSAHHAAKFIGFATRLSSAEIPQTAYDNARRCLLDAIGCGLFGASQPWSAIMDAQYSIPYCAALALTRDPGDPQVFEPAAYNDPALLAIASRVETRVDDECEAVYPSRFGSRVQLHLANGEVKEAMTLDPRGTPADPCSDMELTDKFKRLAALSPLQVDGEAIVRTVRQLDASSASLHELSRVLRPA